MNLASLIDIPSLIAPDAAAIAWPGRIDNESLRTMVARGAGLLTELGVRPGDRVAMLATNSVDAIVGLFATAAVGGVAVPMNFRAKRRELTHLLSDSAARVLLVDSRYAELVEQSRPPSLETVLVLDGDDGWRSAAAAAAPQDELVPVDAEAAGVILYTSGTTSLPKGVILTHTALSDYVMGRTEPADGSDRGRMLLAAPLYHVAGLTSMLGAVYGGRAIVVMPQFEADRWLELVEQERVTHVFLVPTMLARLIECDLSSRDLSSLEVITYGAAPMPPAIIRRAIELFPSSVGFSQAYGQTETTSTVTVLTPEDHRLDGTPEDVAEKRRRLASVGRAVGDVEIRIVAADGSVLPPGDVGEVQLRSRRQMSGYWGREPGAGLDGERWIHTGDLGHLDDGGYLFLGGRAGDMIIRGGENVAPEEVEAVIYEHPAVAEAGVVGIPDEEWGERVAAAVVVRPGSAVGADDLREHCRDRLAGSKRPDMIVFLPELPRTSTGKLLRRALPDLLGGPASNSGHAESGDSRPSI